MADCSYRLRYLPLFYDDAVDILLYIQNNLANPQAAQDLLNCVEQSILQRLPICECFEPYHSKKDRKNNYYKIHVKNYTVFYVVIDDGGPQKIMEVRRLLFTRRDIPSII